MSQQHLSHAPVEGARFPFAPAIVSGAGVQRGFDPGSLWGACVMNSNLMLALRLFVIVAIWVLLCLAAMYSAVPHR